MKKTSLIVTMLTALASFGAMASKCDISEDPGVAKKYSVLLKAYTTSPNVKYFPQGSVKKLSKEIKDCFNEVDLTFELGDGYYDIAFVRFYAVYYPNSTRLAGFIERTGMTYTEAEDPSEVGIYEVRYNSRGQRVSKIGDY